MSCVYLEVFEIQTGTVKERVPAIDAAHARQQIVRSIGDLYEAIALEAVATGEFETVEIGESHVEDS